MKLEEIKKEMEAIRVADETLIKSDSHSILRMLFLLSEQIDIICSDEFAERVASKIIHYKFTVEELWGESGKPETINNET